MMDLWIRAETFPDERRAPLAPKEAGQLVQQGIKVFVEKSTQRIFEDAAYKQEGCEIVNSLSWHEEADKEKTLVLGLKAIDPMPSIIEHKHMYFAHAYKNQPQAKQLLTAFKAGKGVLYDIEYLLNENNVRVASFSYYAGYCAAATAIFLWMEKNKYSEGYSSLPLLNNKDELVELLNKVIIKETSLPNVCLLGNGQLAEGVMHFLNEHKVPCKKLAHADIKNSDFVLNMHGCDIVINAFTTRDLHVLPNFLEVEMLNENDIRLVIDLICEPFAKINFLPKYQNTTTFKNPITKFVENSNINVVAIENYASFLPLESSAKFSKDIYNILLSLLKNQKNIAIEKTLQAFYRSINENKI